MDHEHANAEDNLLDYHLDLVNEDHRDWIERELQQDAVLREKNGRLQRVLKSMDSWTVASAPPDLADRVIGYVNANAAGTEHRTLPFEPAAQRRGTWMPPREWIAAAACILLLVAISVPGLAELRARSRRVMCASNLGTIFRGLTAYQEASDGSLPFAGALRTAAWLPPGTSDRPYASNSRHLYLLVKGRFVPAAAPFLCPGDREAKPMPIDDADRRDDFPSASNCSYASLNLAGADPNVRRRSAVAYLGDSNPLFVAARFDPSVDPERTNSLAHRGRGQTVLTLDGHARWTTRPVYGPTDDNIWLIDNVRRYSGIEVPTRDDDAQLVPGYPLTDPSISATMQH